MSVRHPSRRRGALVALFAVAAAGPVPALAQYKIVGPDGRVTYSDRQPVQAAGKVREIELPAAGDGAAASAQLPPELRAVATRYPVTLYALKNCEGCDAARQFLRARGIPHLEKRVDDGEGGALQKLIGTREVPSLTIGAQVLRGFSADRWASYLDAAGYPRQSQLPANYVAPAPVPLGGVAAPTSPAPLPPAPPSEVVAPPPSTGGIRF